MCGLWRCSAGGSGVEYWRRLSPPRPLSPQLRLAVMTGAVPTLCTNVGLVLDGASWPLLSSHNTCRVASENAALRACLYNVHMYSLVSLVSSRHVLYMCLAPQDAICCGVDTAALPSLGRHTVLFHFTPSHTLD